MFGGLLLWSSKQGSKLLHAAIVQPASQPFYTQFIDYDEVDLLQEQEDAFRQRCVDSEQLWDSIRIHSLKYFKWFLIALWYGLAYIIKGLVWGLLFTVNGILRVIKDRLYDKPHRH